MSVCFDEGYITILVKYLVVELSTAFDFAVMKDDILLLECRLFISLFLNFIDKFDKL